MTRRQPNGRDTHKRAERIRDLTIEGQNIYNKLFSDSNHRVLSRAELLQAIAAYRDINRAIEVDVREIWLNSKY